MVKKWKDKKDMTSPDDWYRSKRYYFLIGYSCHTFYCFQHFFICIKKTSHYLIRCCGIVLPNNYIDLSDFIWVDMSAMKWSGRNTVQTWIWTRGPKNFLILSGALRTELSGTSSHTGPSFTSPHLIILLNLVNIPIPHSPGRIS